MLCMKVAYQTKQEASKDILQIKFDRRKFSKHQASAKDGRKSRAYECPRCGLWHITTIKHRKW